jgi:hypothetical protein
MAYTVNYHGFEVKCDTAADLLALVNGNGSNAKAATKEAPTATQAPARAEVAKFITKLQKEQRALLHHLATQGTVSRDRLREMVGISDTHQFAGILIGIRKSASGAGISSPVEILYERESGRGPRTYQYRLKGNLKADLKEALGIQ